jgi:hypothetical protein
MALLFSTLVCVILAIVLWIASKILKFKKQIFILAAFLSLFYLVIGYVFALIVADRSYYVAVTASVWVLSMKFSYKEGVA